MANNVNIQATVTAKDEASGVLKQFSNNTEKVAKDSAEDFKRVGIAIAAVGVGLTLVAKKATDFTVEYVKSAKGLARETGQTTTQASRLLAVTNRLGLDTDRVRQTFGLFSKQIVQTAQSTDASATALGRLGVVAKNANGSVRDFNSVLLDTADRFKAMPNGPEKTAAALELFGRSGKDMIKFLNLGSEGIKELEAQADKLGLTLNSKTIGAVTEYIQSQKKLKENTDALKIQIGTLTAPVLANFNNKLADVFKTLASSNGVVKQTTANVVAFGGPVLSASGGALTFAANWKTAGLSLAKLGPIAAVVLASIAALATAGYFFKRTWDAITGTIHRTDEAEGNLNDTLHEQATTLEDVTNATKDLTRSRLDEEGSALDLERAQRNYNEAVKEYGPKSLEAREAAHNLEEAKLRLSDAQQKVAESQELVNQKEAEYKMVGAEAAASIQLRIDKFAGLAGTIHAAAGEVISLDNTINQRLAPLQGSIQNIQGSVKTLQGSIQNLQGTKVGLQGGAIQLQGSRAEGGPITAGNPYLVGERGPEVIIPEQNGTVVPNGKSAGSIINLNVNVGMYAGSEIEKRKMAQQILDAMKDLAGSSNMSLGELIK